MLAMQKTLLAVRQKEKKKRRKEWQMPQALYAR